MAKIDLNKLKKGGVVVIEKDFSEIEGTFLRELRMKLKMSQTLFADYLGVSKKTIEKWEQGKNQINGPVARLLFLINENNNILSKFKTVMANKPENLPKFKTVIVNKKEDFLYENDNDNLEYFRKKFENIIKNDSGSFKKRLDNEEKWEINFQKNEVNSNAFCV